MNPNVGREGARPVTDGSTSKSQTGKFESVPPSTTKQAVPSWSSSWIGSKKYGIDMLMRAALATLNESGSMSAERFGSR